MTRWFSRVRRGPLLAALGTVALLGLLTYGLLIKGNNKAIDNNLANGRATPAPGFDLPVLLPDQGHAAPGFALPRLSHGLAPHTLSRVLHAAFADSKLSIEELRGTPVVLNFWASWCAPCREEAPILERGWRRDASRGVLYLGLNIQDLTGDAQQFLKEFRISYPTIRDQGPDVARSYGATGIPETYFIDRRSRVVGHVVGVVTPQLLATGVRAARAGQVVGTEQGGARKSQR